MSHSNKQAHFVVPVRYYVATFVSLLILTFFTVVVARFDFGKWNIVVAMSVAVVKATLVGMIFMGLRWDKKMNAAFFISSFAFLAIFLSFSLMDVASRHQTDPLEAQHFGFKTPVKLIHTHTESGSVHK